jgi:formylglycine-generating enzyme
MTLGRLAMFAAILAASVAVASVLVRRHHRALAERIAPPAPSSVPAPVPSSFSPVAPVSAAPSASAERELAVREPAGATEDPLTDALCPSGMVLVDGTSCAARTARCAEAEPTISGGCKRFEPAECRKGQTLRFCVDRYEYPNLAGVVPTVMVTFEQARSACEEEDKRLCSDTEWRFACEGREGYELSYGNSRDPAACNVGRRTERLRPEELWEPRDVSRVVARVDRRVASGTMNRCESPFGVHDTTGNVEEWGTGASGIEAALMGGDSSVAEPTCRSVKKTRQTAFRSPHAGFRCCRDPLVRAKARPTTAGQEP